MQLWPMLLLWPKPKARQHTRINLQFARRSSKHKLLHIFIINAMLLITTVTATTIKTTLGSPTSAATQQQHQQQQHHQQQQMHSGNYEGVDAVAALTGLSNGYATPNYIKNYYQLTAEASANEQQQHQQQQHNTAGNTIEQHDSSVGPRNPSVATHAAIFDLQSNNYGNSIVARGGQGGEEEVFDIHDTGFRPTTLTAAGQHYVTTIEGLQAITDKNKAHPFTRATTTSTSTSNTAAIATNKIDLEQQQHQHQQQHQQQQYGHARDNKANHQSLFGRLSNYGDDLLVDEDDNDGGVGRIHGRSIGLDVGLENYALAYADDAQQSTSSASSLASAANFYNNAHNTYNGNEQQSFANYFTPTTVELQPTIEATYEIENQQKYYTLNNYEENETQQQPEQEQHQQHQQQQQHHVYNRPFRQQTYKLQAYETTQTPATYYETYIQHNNNDKDDKQQQITNNNYPAWNLKQHQQQQQQNQITANYANKQLHKQQHEQHYKQHQDQEEQLQPQHHPQHHYDKLLQEPETAETSYNTQRYTKPHKNNKSKRSDSPIDSYELSENSLDSTNIQLQQLQQLQEQIQQQQQQFIQLQHQLIEHDQQLQIQKHHVQQPAPILPPITHTVHHNPNSLQALAGTPLTKHTQVVKSIPITQHHQVHVPYRQNVPIEVPDPIITTVNKPTPIEIPITKTIAIPDIKEIKIPIEKIRPFPVERPIPYIVEKRVPYTVEKQIAKPVYYHVPIKVPIIHTVVHKTHPSAYSHNNYHYQPNHHQYHSHHLPHTVYKHVSSHGHGHGYGNAYGHSYGHSRYGGNYLK